MSLIVNCVCLRKYSQLCYGVLQEGLAIQMRDLVEDLTSFNIIIVWGV